jgi:oxygen-dependent protoporphyrinogen oxidase
MGRPGSSNGSGRRGGGGQNGTRASAPEPLAVDGVVLAVPAVEAAVLLALHAPVAAGLLSSIRYASVAVVTLSFPEGAIGARLDGTGFLVPRTSDVDGRPPLITGVTYLGRKWPHLARPEDELIRASVGRFGDERHATLNDGQLTASVVDELSRLLDIDTSQPEAGQPEAMVTRWDDAFPQYEVGHLIRVGRVEEAVSELGAVAVAGAALRGAGIPACIASGRSAARHVLSALHPVPVQNRPGGAVPSGSG